MDLTRMTFLGTGNAVSTRYYNTCFLLQNGNSHLLVDGGGGNTILNRLPEAGMEVTQVHEIFMTHAHIDHMLGVLWLVRYMITRMKKGVYAGDLNVYTHDKGIQVLDTICKMTLPQKDYAYIGDRIHFWEIKDQDHLTVGCFQMQIFDVHSTKEKQFGFKMTLPSGNTLVCLGDEPFNEVNRAIVEQADWLLCEAYCLYEDRDEFRPYQKKHSTARDAGRTAEDLGIRNLVLYHTEDKTYGKRKTLYSEEAKSVFHGNVWIPEDLESITLDGPE